MILLLGMILGVWLAVAAAAFSGLLGPIYPWISRRKQMEMIFHCASTTRWAYRNKLITDEEVSVMFATGKWAGRLG